MKPENVPQDRLPYYEQGRKAIYAVDGEGHFTMIPSSGWTVEDTVTRAAADEYARLAQEALARARCGKTSSLEFHMYAQRMDVPQLAQSVRLWQWRVQRHLRPAIFTGLSPALRARYAEALGLSLEQLAVLPAGEGA